MQNMNKENEIISRRNFIKTTGVAGLGIPFMNFTGTQIFNKSNADNSLQWKIFMFSKHLQFLDYQETAETMAEAGLEGADLTVRPGGHVLPENTATDLPKAVNALNKQGLKVGMLTTRINNTEDKYTEEILSIAHNLGIKYYRLGYLKYHNEKGIVKSLEDHKANIEKLALLNEKYSIHGGYQNHAGTRVGGPVWDLWHILNGLNPEYIGCQYDIRHAVLEGGSSWPLAIKLLKNYIKTIVIKDFKWIKNDKGWRGVSVPLGEGMVDFQAFFKLLKTLKIAAPLSLHFEYPLYAGKQLSKKEKRKQAVKTISKEVKKLKTMLKDADLIPKD